MPVKFVLEFIVVPITQPKQMNTFNNVCIRYGYLVINDLPPKSWNISHKCVNIIAKQACINSEVYPWIRPQAPQMNSKILHTHHVISCDFGSGVMLFSFFNIDSFQSLT